MALTDATRNYLTTLAGNFGLDAAAIIAKAEKDEAAAKFVDESVMLRSDYSRNMDKLTAAQKEAAEAKAKAEGYYANEWLPKWQQREQEVQKAQAELNQYKAEAAAYKAVYGDLEGFKPSPAAGGPAAPGQPAGQPAVVASPANGPQYMTREDAAALSGTLAKEMTWVAEMHRDEFGKRIDVDAFEKHVMSGKYSGPRALRDAYADFTREAREAKQKADLDAQLAAAKKAGADEYAAAHAMPLDNGAPAPRGSQLFHPPSKDDPTAAVLADPNAPTFVKDEAMRREFLKDLNGAQLTGALFKS